MPTSLKDKIVVIFGGSSGMGLATARAALDNGAHVKITGRSAERLETAAGELGAAAQIVQLDATDEAGTRAFIDGLPSLDHLFITAGALVMDHHLEPDSSDLRPAMDTRFWSAFYAAKYAAPKMPEGGSITFMSGSSGRRPLPGSSVASASCAAIDTFARALALDLAPVRVNSIQLGIGLRGYAPRSIRRSTRGGTGCGGGAIAVETHRPTRRNRGCRAVPDAEHLCHRHQSSRRRRLCIGVTVLAIAPGFRCAPSGLQRTGSLDGA